MNYIPTTIIDNFFDDPLWVRNYALKQEFEKDPMHFWPGKRTKCLSEINPKLFNYTLNRFCSLFYPKQDFNYRADVHFQLIDASYVDGWIHKDSNLFSGIIYLNDNISKNCGTTIYRPKTEGVSCINTEFKKSFFSGQIESDDLYKKQNNEQFEETIIIKNRFNRLIAFDANLYHGANDFQGNEEKDDKDSRLTLVFFVSKLDAAFYPIQNMKFGI